MEMVILHSWSFSSLRALAEEARVAPTSSKISTSSATTTFSRSQCLVTPSKYSWSPLGGYSSSQHSKRVRSTASGTGRNSWMCVGLSFNTAVRKTV